MKTKKKSEFFQSTTGRGRGSVEKQKYGSANGCEGVCAGSVPFYFESFSR